MVVWSTVEALVAVVAAVDETVVHALHSAGALAHTARRRALSILLEREPLGRERLAALLAADETVPHDDAERIELTLHHEHLPRLEAELFVEYDHRSGDVVLWKEPDAVRESLESV